MSLFSAVDQALFLREFGQDIPVRLYGADVKTIRGIAQYELVVDSPGGAEIGSSALVLYLEPEDYNSLDKASKYTFFVENVERQQRGPVTMDDTGYVRMQLTKA